MKKSLFDKLLAKVGLQRIERLPSDVDFDECQRAGDDLVRSLLGPWDDDKRRASRP